MPEIWLPDTVRTFKCEVPDCGEEFVDQAKFMRHVTICARKHRERILEASEAHRAEVDADPFQRVWDPEALEFVQRRVREGKQ